jgi:hypothetical protein
MSERRWVSGPVDDKELALIMVAVELGYTYCEKGYSLQAAKEETTKELRYRHKPEANEP